jgi:hypothetical protein
LPVVRSLEKIGDSEVAVLIEVAQVPTGVANEDVYRAARGGKSEKVVEAAAGLFDQGIELARTCARKAVEVIQQGAEATRPDEFQVQLSISLDAEVGAVLAKSSAGAQLQVTMVWRRA